MNSDKTCLFCGVGLHGKGNRQGRTVEHIVPKWLMDHLGGRDQQIAPALHEIETGALIGRRQHSVKMLLAGSVCATCNNGWMSLLETQAKPILIRLIGDPDQLVKLTEAERLIISRWTVKTAAALNRASPCSDPKYPSGRPMPKEHLRLLSAGSIPDSVVVVGGAYNSEKAFDFMQSTSWTWPRASVPLREEDKDRSYKVAVAFCGLVLAVAYFPNSDYLYGIREGMYVPLWTGIRGVRQHHQPLNDLPPVTTSPMLEGFLENIWAISRTWLEIVDNASTTKLVQIPGTDSPHGR
jgi:hypothetical protein